jgi:hypothetical protein
MLDLRTAACVALSHCMAQIWSGTSQAAATSRAEPAGPRAGGSWQRWRYAGNSAGAWRSVEALSLSTGARRKETTPWSVIRHGGVYAAFYVMSPNSDSDDTWATVYC